MFYLYIVIKDFVVQMRPSKIQNQISQHTNFKKVQLGSLLTVLFNIISLSNFKIVL